MIDIGTAVQTAIATGTQFDLDLAKRAHSNTTFADPADRAEMDKRSVDEHFARIAEQLVTGANADQHAAVVTWMHGYVNGYIERLHALYRAKAGTASAFVTGRANFNQRRNDKAVDAVVKAERTFVSWQENQLDVIRQHLKTLENDHQRGNREWQTFSRSIAYLIGEITACDAEGKPEMRKAYANQIAAGLAKASPFVQKRALVAIRNHQTRHPLYPPILTNRHKVWREFLEAQGNG